jgi:hypothetical protein
MNTLSTIGTQPSEFVCVIRLANCYIATHIKERNKAFISKHPEIEKIVAESTAKIFATQNKIPYVDELLEPDRPIITIMKDGEHWYPAELHSKKIILLLMQNFQDIGSDEQGAIRIAETIALREKSDCIPSIGISIEVPILTQIT